MSNQKPKILYIDIENSRMVVEFETYSLYNIDRIHPKHVKHDWYITCAAWGWLDNESKKIKQIGSVKGSDFRAAYKKDFRNDYNVVKKLHEIVTQADLIIGHNSDAFDIKKLNYKFIKYGLEPVDFPPTVDTIKAARKYAKSTSNSLYYLAKEFKVPMKIELPSHVMHRADAGCKKSLDKLAKYNKGDIVSGANLYFKLLPYIKNHPDLNKILRVKDIKENKENSKCPSCGSFKTQKHGVRVTKTGKVQRYRCNNCGSAYQ